MAFKMKGNPIKMGGMATKAVAKMKEPMKMKSPMELKEKSPELEKKSAMDMKSPMEAAKPDFPDIDGDGNTTESMKDAAADKKAGGPKMKSPMEAGHKDSPMDAGHEDSPMEAGHEDSPMEAEHDDSPAKSVRYFGQNTNPKEMKDVTNHNKKFHPSQGVTKEGHKDHA
jgi:hypothetical protein